MCTSYLNLIHTNSLNNIITSMWQLEMLNSWIFDEILEHVKLIYSNGMSVTLGDRGESGMSPCVLRVFFMGL